MTPSRSLALTVAAGLAALLLPAAPALARQAPAAAPAPAVAAKTIVETVAQSRDHTQLATLLKASDLADTLSGPGPFTVFAPTNAGVDLLPRGEFPSMLKPDGKRRLNSVLSYHVVRGALTAKDIEALVKKGGGQATLETLHGAYITVTQSGRALVLTDLNGERARITAADLAASNGVVHVVNRMLTP